MTFYDDAEFAAIRLTREALAEDGGTPRSVDMHEVVFDMFKRHGSNGVSALAIALGRHLASTLAVIAHSRGVTTGEVLDAFELHKLEQHQLELDEGE